MKEIKNSLCFFRSGFFWSPKPQGPSPMVSVSQGSSCSDESPFSDDDVSVVAPVLPDPPRPGFPPPDCAFIRRHLARAFWNQT